MPELPEEIIALILDHLRLPNVGSIDRASQSSSEVANAFATLTTISRTSRSLLVEPVLYRVFPGCQHVDSLLFLAALAAKPHRASLVHEIVLDPTDLGVEHPGDSYNEYGYHEWDYDGRDLLPTHLNGGLHHVSDGENVATNSKLEPDQARAGIQHPLSGIHTVVDSVLPEGELNAAILEGLDSGRSRLVAIKRFAVILERGFCVNTTASDCFAWTIAAGARNALRGSLLRYWLTEHCNSAVLSLILLMCRKVKLLDIIGQEMPVTNTFTLVLDEVARQAMTTQRWHQDAIAPIKVPDRYATLQRVVLRHFEPALGFCSGSLHHTAPLLRLESVKHVAFYGGDFRRDRHLEHFALEPTVVYSNIRSVQLYDCLYDESSVALLLDACPNLSSFVIGYNKLWEGPEGGSDDDDSELGLAKDRLKQWKRARSCENGRFLHSYTRGDERSSRD